MTPFLSRRLLINLAVVVAAVGANAFVAYTQICGQRETDLRTLRSTDIRENLDAYRAAAIRLGCDPSALGELRSRLELNRRSASLFDTAGYTRDLEAAYLSILPDDIRES